MLPTRWGVVSRQVGMVVLSLFNFILCELPHMWRETPERAIGFGHAVAIRAVMEAVSGFLLMEAG